MSAPENTAALIERLERASTTTLSAMPTGGPPQWMRDLLREAADRLAALQAAHDEQRARADTRAEECLLLLDAAATEYGLRLEAEEIARAALAAVEEPALAACWIHGENCPGERTPGVEPQDCRAGEGST